jgi:hypothetical protein
MPHNETTSQLISRLLGDSLLEVAKKPERRKCFISYSHFNQDEVKQFLETFADAFIPKVLGVNDKDDFINSTDPDYVMGRIRELYLQDSTVTILLIGSCTHSRRYIDWELKSTLRRGSYTPNGLLGITLPSTNGSSHLPERFKSNWENGEESCYAMYRSYPASVSQLKQWIETAYDRRTSRAENIQNSQEMWTNNHEMQYL